MAKKKAKWNNNNKSTRELLIRIDERQVYIRRDVQEIKKKLDKKVDNVVYLEHCKRALQIKGKVDKHEKYLDRLTGYAVGIAGSAGTIGGIIGNLLNGILPFGK